MRYALPAMEEPGRRDSLAAYRRPSNHPGIRAQKAVRMLRDCDPKRKTSDGP